MHHKEGRNTQQQTLPRFNILKCFKLFSQCKVRVLIFWSSKHTLHCFENIAVQKTRRLFWARSREEMKNLLHKSFTFDEYGICRPIPTITWMVAGYTSLRDQPLLLAGNLTEEHAMTTLRGRGEIG